MNIIEARKHLKKYQAELNKYQSLSRELMGYDDLIHTDKKITYFKKCIANIREQINAH
ncbi:hypothetical protein [Acinetobacter nectaris]|uniref:Uncharacterized protein n=1 Tax=Acinetobacter nectaris CIP 110549 TaxID=1392540 RepID=V2V0I4_9GAMM|nr:hypothetical protein [Acinetobacter nectaris]ESK41064.1 hypothetical protein P256_00049 [Acinetobacter nectaris CIP 110549]MCF9034413.1 hypothetical protein [Acinetobacter nectaris]